MPCTMSGEDVLQQLQAQITRKQLRPHEFFADFDRLRTGLVTRTQFERCVSAATGLMLDAGAWDAFFALSPAPPRPDGLVPYAPLVAMLSLPCSQAPEKVVPSDLAPLLHQALEILRNHGRVHGSGLRAAFRDFDPHNRGLVSVTQFQRNLPAPASLSAAHRSLLQAHYGTPDARSVDYFALLRDVEGYPAPALASYRPATRGVGDIVLLPPAAATDPSHVDVAVLVDQLAAAFHRTRVRPLEFMRDHDPLRHGEITQPQFVSALAQTCAAPGGLRLSMAALQAVAAEFRGPRGGVRYRDFCHRTDNAFLTGMMEDLERVPTAEVAPLLRSQVTCEAQTLDPDSEQAVQHILAKLREVVEARRISVHPLLQDADHRFGFTKGVTSSQLARVLDVLGLSLPIHEMALINSKFTNPVTGHVNYPAFVAAIDPTTKFAQTEQLFTDTAAITAKHLDTLSLSSTGLKTGLTGSLTREAVDVDAALDRVRLAILERSLRVKDVFAEADPLRRGHVHRDRFVRGLAQIAPTLGAAALEGLADRFARGGDVDWRAFAAAVEAPDATQSLSDSGQAARTLRGTLRQRQRETTFDPALQPVYSAAMAAASAYLFEHRFDLAGKFADADGSKRLHVTEAQFVRELTSANLGLTQAQIRVLALYYLDDKGVDYVSFVNDVTPPPVQEDLFRSQTARRLNTARPQSRVAESSDVLEQVKLQIVRERVNVGEQMRDFDPLRHGRITASEYARSLAAAKLTLSAEQLGALQQLYASASHPGEVEYARFLDDVSACFAPPHLEKNPTAATMVFIPPADIEIAAQTRKQRPEESIAERLLRAMAVRVMKERIDVAPPFKDFDRAVIGTVSKSQFQRVLAALALCPAATEAEQAALLAKYSVRAGGREDVHYRSFVNDLQQLALGEHARTVSL